MIRPAFEVICQTAIENMKRAIESVQPKVACPAYPEVEPIPPGPGANHSPDFASVNWFGRVYTFTRPQAEVVAALWQAWRDDCPFLSQQTLLDASNSESTRLRDVFKNHPAWGAVIQHGPSCGGTMGTYRLVPVGS